jgi:bla regulator protein BlaR1
MENLFYNISQVFGITIIHSLWQGLLVWLSLRLLFASLPSLSSGKKHNLGMVAMFSIIGWFVYTLIGQVQAHTWVDLKTVTVPLLLPHIQFPDNEALQTTPVTYLNYAIGMYLPYLSALYFAGLVFNLLRMGLNWQKISLIKRTMIPAGKAQVYVDAFCKKLHINNYVSVNFSRMINVPCMIGFFKPIILLPISLTTYLSTQEIEAILLHELSHIKRHDYLINLVQQVITILLFFNPFAQLINRIINQERENRCDDLVVQTTAQPLIYAQALLKLEQTKQVNLPLALAATGKQYHLLNRIERIMKTKKPIGNVRHLLVAIVIMAASISSIAWLNPTIKDGKLSIKKALYPKALTRFIPDTAHKKLVKKNVIVKKTKSKHVSIQTHDNFNDAELSRLTAEVNKHADAIDKYYNGPEFKKQTDILEQKGKVIEDYYNKPEIKRIQEKQEKLAAEVQKDWGDGSEVKALGEQMHQLGDKIGKYFNTPEFKKMNDQLKKKYGIPDNNYVENSKDENYQKYQDELKSKIPNEVNQQTEQLKKLGEQMRSRYNSPELRKKTEEMRAMGDSMRKVYGNPDMKRHQDEMKKIGEQMRSYQNNPQMKREHELLEQASKKLRDYTNSPAFRKHVEDYRKQVESAFYYKSDVKIDTAYN